MAAIVATRLFSVVNVGALDGEASRAPVRGDESFTVKYTVEGGREVTCHFVVLRLDASCVVWVGTAGEGALASMAMAIQPKRGHPSATAILPGTSDEDLASAARLCKRTGLVVTFGSCIVDLRSDVVRRLVEKTVVASLA